MKTMFLYVHPFSSYSWKALIALYENATPFVLRSLEDEAANRELAEHWPLRKFPVLVDGDRVIPEASVIVEHLDVFHSGPVRFIPADSRDAIDVRIADRVFDLHVQAHFQRIVGNALRPAELRDARGVDDARAALEVTYAWLDAHMATREWAAACSFTLADCAAAPALFYADWTHAIDPKFANLHAYRRRLLARPSVARVVDEARPFRSYFPLGAPDHD
jgi:glutathione S-transferase